MPNAIHLKAAEFSPETYLEENDLVDHLEAMPEFADCAF